MSSRSVGTSTTRCTKRSPRPRPCRCSTPWWRSRCTVPLALPGATSTLTRLAQRRHLDGRAEDGLGEGDVGLVVQVVTVTLEAAVVLHAQVHEEATVRSAAQTGRAAVAQAHRRAVLDAGRHLDRQRRRLVAASVAATVRARRVDARAHAVAARAGHRGHHLAEDRVAHALHDADARRTRRTSSGEVPGAQPEPSHVVQRCASVTVTSLVAPKAASSSVMSSEISASGPGWGPRRCWRVSAESAEEHVEDVLDRPGAEGVAAGPDVRTETVVVRAALGVREDLVGLGDLFEAGLGRGVVVGVGVVLARESPVGALQLLLGAVVTRPRGSRRGRC